MTVTRLDVLARLADPRHLDDPFPVLAWLREHDPLHQEADGTYYLSRHADVVEVLRSDAIAGLARPVPADASPYQRMLCAVMPSKNPPEHGRLRGQVSRGFTARRIDGLRPKIERITAALLAPLRDGDTVDLHETVSMKVPLAVIAELIGVPASDRDEVGALVAAIIPVLAGGRDDLRAAADEAAERLHEYFRGLFVARGRSPQDDLVSALVHHEDPLDEDELVSTLCLLWIAGFETTASAIDHGVLAMTAYPDEVRWLRDEPAHFVEEVLRHQSVVQFTAPMRVALRDVELSGGVLPRGARLRVLPAAANRDPAAFGDPDVFRPARFTEPAAPVLTLGHGPHLCLGARLARLELAVVLTALHARFPELKAEPPVRRPQAGLRALERLPVRLS